MGNDDDGTPIIQGDPEEIVERRKWIDKHRQKKKEKRKRSEERECRL
jgi:hypothetical protein